MRTRRTLCSAAVMLLAPLATASSQRHVASFDSAWASISRTYYDTTLIRDSWTSQHDSLRTALGDAPTLDQVREAIRALIAFPAQSHFVLIPSEAVPKFEADAPPSASSVRGTAGLDLRLVGDTLVVWRVQDGAGAARAGVRPGQVVTHVEKQEFGRVLTQLQEAFPEPREARMVALQFVYSRLGGPQGDTIRLTVGDTPAEARTVHIVRGPLEGRISQFGNLPPLSVRATLDSVAVATAGGSSAVPLVYFSGWFPIIIQDLDRIFFGIRGAPGVILDLRGNPGGVVGMIGGVAGHFTDTAVTLGTLRGRGSTLNIRTNPRKVDRGGQRVEVITAPLAILVDEFTASSSEFFAAGMQAIGRAKVFGSTSAGQSLPALMARLPSGDVLMHPIADHLDANGRRVEGIGVVPDVVTPLRRADLAAGRDAPLHAARRWLAESMSTP